MFDFQQIVVRRLKAFGLIVVPVEGQGAGILEVRFSDGQQYALNKSLALFGVENGDGDSNFTKGKGQLHGIMACGFEDNVGVVRIVNGLDEVADTVLIIAEILSVPILEIERTSGDQIVFADVDTDEKFG